MSDMKIFCPFLQKFCENGQNNEKGQGLYGSWPFSVFKALLTARAGRFSRLLYIRKKCLL